MAERNDIKFRNPEFNHRPEQAIAATVGRPTFDANLEQALSFMRIWISEDAHLGESELSAAFEKAEGLRKLDAIESAIVAALGGGECDVKHHNVETSGDADEWVCLSCGERWLQDTDWPMACPGCGEVVK